MLKTLSSLFGRQSLDLFRQMAATITSEYIEDISNKITKEGVDPSFEDLLQKIKALNNELALKAVWLKDNYNNERGRKSTRLTNGCKKIIKMSNDDFLRTVKVIMAQKRHPYLKSSTPFGEKALLQTEVRSLR